MLNLLIEQLLDLGVGNFDFSFGAIMGKQKRPKNDDASFPKGKFDFLGHSVVLPRLAGEFVCTISSSSSGQVWQQYHCCQGCPHWHR